MSRLDLIRDAQRPKMQGRALFKGPQGSGKTWTMLSVARHMTAGKGTIVAIDTERESMLTYADVFTFKHLPWRPPFDTAELTGVLDSFATHGVPRLGIPAPGTDDVLIIDSASHFWQGTGGILDVANGRVQGGWDKARPIQNAWVEQLLAMPCHVLLGARMKNSVQITDNGKTVESIGLTVVQDDALEYELNIVVQMDMQHGATVTKSRTPAVPVGRVYPGGYESKLATDYDEWLAGGVPPANREDVDRIVAVFGNIADSDARKALKAGFVEEFGMPHSLTAEQVPAALAWLEAQGAAVGEGPAAEHLRPGDEGDATIAQDDESGPEASDTAEPAPDAAETHTDADPATVTPPADADDAPAETASEPSEDEVAAIVYEVQQMNADTLTAALKVAGLPISGNADTRRRRLAEHLIRLDTAGRAEQGTLA